MEKEIRSTLYLPEDLMKRYREACNKKFGDKQGKIKQGYFVAITNFCDEVLGSESTVEPPTFSAKKLIKAEPPPTPRTNVSEEMLQHEQEASDSEPQKVDVEAEAKKLAEQRKKESNHQVLT